MVVYVVSFYDKDMEQVEIVAVTNTLRNALDHLAKIVEGGSHTVLDATHDTKWDTIKLHWRYDIDGCSYWITERKVL